MEVKVETISYDELIDLYNTIEQFLEFLESEKNTEVEKRKK